jgi:DNA-binding SARP family transcriptional activator/tetratricopeptide (TPR) repeat protein
VEFRLLGRLEVEHEGRTLTPKRRQERRLLGVLLLEANTPVPVERLVGLLWDGLPPAGARATLQTYVSRLRSALDPDDGGGRGLRLLRSGDGYLAQVDPEAVDALRFRALVERAGTTGEAATRARALREALDLWRGPLLAGDASEHLSGRVATRWEEARLSAVEAAAEAGLACGQHVRLIGELRTLVAEHPYRERFTALLMLACCRAGRRAEALAAYQSARRVLIGELGLEPGPELRALHERVLAGDIEPAPPATEAAPSRTPASQPAQSAQSPQSNQLKLRQLPSAPGNFMGRDAELGHLSAVARGSDADTGAVTISSIEGMAGVGKTALALNWAHRNLDRFPDGQLFVDLSGFTPSGEPVDPAAAIRGFLGALGVDPGAFPAEPDAQAALFRSLVAGKRMLILLDNARDSDQVIPLLPGSSACTVLVTSRRRLSGLVSAHGARPLALDLLADPQALDLLAQRLGADRLAAEPEAVRELLALCGGLPLALGVVAARAAAHPGFPLRVLATELGEATTRLAALDTGELSASVQAALFCSYRVLDFQDAEVFALLGLASGPDIGLAAAAALTALPIARTRTALRTLEAASLVRENVPGRYQMHDLIRLYAAERADHDQTPDARTQALRRTADFFLHTAHNGDRLLVPQRQPIHPGQPTAGCLPAPIADGAAALAWFDVEHSGVLAAQNTAVAQGWYRHGWQLAWSLNSFHNFRGRLADQVAVWQVGLEAAERLGQPGMEARILCHRTLGHALARAGRYPEAVEQLGRAIELAEGEGDTTAQAHAHRTLARAWALQEHFDQALEHALRAHDLLRGLGRPAWEAEALNEVGWCHARLGDLDRGRSACGTALALQRQHHDREGEAYTLDNLAYIAVHSGQHAQAVDYYGRALVLWRDLGHQYNQAGSLDRLAGVHAALGDHEQARDRWQQALTLYRTQHRTADVDRVQARLGELEQPRLGRP